MSYGKSPPDHGGARISEVAEYDDGIAMATLGGVDGPTYNAFAIEDASLTST